jgi:hypothetical protein
VIMTRGNGRERDSAELPTRAAKRPNYRPAVG